MRISVALLGLFLPQTQCACTPTPTNPSEVVLEVPRVDGGQVAAHDEVGTVRFGRTNARVGDRAHVSILAESRWDEQVSSYASEFVTEVLAVEGPAPSRVRIEFRKNETFDNVTHQATPIDGHSYIVDVREPHVVDATTNAPPTADEVTRVTDVLPDLGTRSQIDQVLPDGAMRIGEHRDDIARAITRILHPRIWSLDEGSAELVRTERDRAVFRVALRATSSATSMKIDLKGETRVRLADARLEGFTLEGTFARTNGETGAFTVERTVTD